MKTERLCFCVDIARILWGQDLVAEQAVIFLNSFLAQNAAAKSI